jgi:hypothetical protein
LITRLRVFPETWFNNKALSETLEQVLPDGRVILDIKDDNNLPLISMTLYGRNFHLDGPLPTDFCPHEDDQPITANKPTLHSGLN